MDPENYQPKQDYGSGSGDDYEFYNGYGNGDGYGSYNGDGNGSGKGN